MTLGWVVKAAAVVGAVSLAGFDAGSIGVCRLGAADLARAAALAASSTPDAGPRAAYEAAVRRVHETDPAASVPAASFELAPDGSVRLVVRRAARTYLVDRIGAARGWAVVEAVGTAPASP